MNGKRRSDPVLPFVIAGVGLVAIVLIVVCIFVFCNNDKPVLEQPSVMPGDQQSQNADKTVGAANNATDNSQDGPTHTEKWQEGAIRYDGRAYKYNTNLRTYLFMGIDNDDPVSQAEDYLSGGQADALFLMVVDNLEKKISVIAINRNTMTDIEICDLTGRSIGTFTAQICLQHGYGDGMRMSCQKTVDAVSYLFYDIPISGYLAMNMGGLSVLNDSIGGVELVIPDNFSTAADGIIYRAGEKVKLDGASAYRYVRYRDTTEFDSASARLSRNEAYLDALIHTMSAFVDGSNSRALGIYDLIEPYTVTDIEFAELAEDISKYGFTDSDLYTIKGEIQKGSQFEEFYIDESELFRLIIDIFYVTID